MSPCPRTAGARVLRPLGGAVLALLITGPPASGIAATPVPHPYAGGIRAFQSSISMDEAVDRAQRRYNARVIRADVSEEGGRRVFVLRMLSESDGRVFVVRIDAETGAER